MCDLGYPPFAKASADALVRKTKPKMKNKIVAESLTMMTSAFGLVIFITRLAKIKQNFKGERP